VAFFSGLVVLIPAWVVYCAHPHVSLDPMLVVPTALAPVPPTVVALHWFRPERPAIRLTAISGAIAVYCLVWLLVLVIPGWGLVVLAGPACAGATLAQGLVDLLCGGPTLIRRGPARPPSSTELTEQAMEHSAGRRRASAVWLKRAAALMGAVIGSVLFWTPYQLGLFSDSIYLVPLGLSLASLFACSVFLVAYLGRHSDETSEHPNG